MAELLSGNLFHRLLQVERAECPFVQAFIINTRKIGFIVCRPHSSNQHISHLVVVRSVALLRRPAPLPIITVLSGIEADFHIVEELRTAAAPVLGEGRFRRYGISFKKGRTGKDCRKGTGCQLPRDGAEKAEKSGELAELQLAYMPAFVQRELIHPGPCLHAVCLGRGEEIHGTRSPGNAAVGVCVERMENHRHGFFIKLIGRRIAGIPHHLAVFFKGVCIFPGKGIQPGRVNQTETGCLYLTPFHRRFVAGGVKLCRQGQGCQEAGCNKCQDLFHGRKDKDF